MSWARKIFVAILPKSWAAAMETESRAWMVQCVGCDYERSVWDWGSIRWKAKGTTRTVMKCPSCHKRKLHTIYFKK